jgi:hypothetical protein
MARRPAGDARPAPRLAAPAPKHTIFLVQLAIALTIVGIVCAKLINVDYSSLDALSALDLEAARGSNCLLCAPASTTSAWLCVAAIAGGLLSALAALFLALSGGGAPGAALRAFKLVLLALTFAWWLAAAVATTIYGVRANDAAPPVPAEDFRTAVMCLAWMQLILHFLTLVDLEYYVPSPPPKLEEPEPEEAEGGEV